jgi:NDP-mannose synthase
MTEGIYEIGERAIRRHSRAADGVSHAVVLAGGKGTRLAPYTSVLPKPLMPIGDRSILELVVDQLTAAGVEKITLCVGYLSHLIEAVLSHRSADTAEVAYVHEDHPVGTAAPLRSVERLDSTFMAMNGDVLTTLDYGALFRYHREQANVLTVATQERTIKSDYGVLDVGNAEASGRVRAYREKPEHTSIVSMGIYVLEPEALDYIPPQGHFDFPDLVHALLNADEPVGAYRHEGLWFDIGRREDYEVAARAWADAQADERVELRGSAAAQAR